MQRIVPELSSADLSIVLLAVFLVLLDVKKKAVVVMHANG
jgi:hypothetical protein